MEKLAVAPAAAAAAAAPEIPDRMPKESWFSCADSAI
jgi:hypothetical protein